MLAREYGHYVQKLQGTDARVRPGPAAAACDWSCRSTAAGRIGDDFIQQNLGGGTVDQNSFTHGTSQQRQRWFSTGYAGGDPNACDTFGTDDLG